MSGLLSSVRGALGSAPRWSSDQLTIAWQSASLLLDYPDERLIERLAMVTTACGELPSAVGSPLLAVADALAARDLGELQEEYVTTFDSRRRCNLFLTYFAHGDTRKRGAALLRFKQAYLAAGVQLDEAELPDHLCVVLEFAACVDQRTGRQLLLDHRAGLELLRMSLRDMGSPWAGVLEAVCTTLPPLRGDEEVAVRRLAAEGPPAEEVGLSPYGTAVDLPMPSVRTAPNRPEGA